MPCRALTLLTLSLLGLIPQQVVCGQSVEIVGRIHLAGDSARVIGDAEVALLPGLRRVRSDASGEFRFAGVSSGVYTLRTRSVGFSPATQDVRIDPANGTQVRVDVALTVGAQVLAEIKISGNRTLYPARLAEPFARASSGRGAFFTRDLIDSLKPYDAFSLMAMVPGMRVRGNYVSSVACTNQGASMGTDAQIQVYVNGLRMTKYDSSERPPTESATSSGGLSFTAGMVLRDILMSSVELIEIHKSINTIPGEYMSDACGVILVWTK